MSVQLHRIVSGRETIFSQGLDTIRLRDKNHSITVHSLGSAPLHAHVVLIRPPLSAEERDKLSLAIEPSQISGMTDGESVLYLPEDSAQSLALTTYFRQNEDQRYFSQPLKIAHSILNIIES